MRFSFEKSLLCKNIKIPREREGEITSQNLVSLVVLVGRHKM